MKENIKIKDFEKIYNNTYNKILRFIVVKSNNFEEINDILQETYIEFYKKIKKEKNLKIDNLDNFLMGIASNIIKRHYPKNNVIFISPDDEKQNIELKNEFDIEQNFITKENVQDIWKYIKNKDLITGKIFYLYYSLDLKISEIAKSLNLNESYIKNKIYRTLHELKKLFEKECD